MTILNTLKKLIAHRRTWLGLLVVVGVGLLGRVFADYVGSLANRIFVDPASLSVIADGYQNGDVVSFILETTPANTGSDSGHAAWATLYVPPGVEVVGAEFVQPLADGSYSTVGAEDTDKTFDGWGSRGAAGYTPATGATRLGEGFVNEVQQDTGIFYSSDPLTALLPAPLTDLTPTGPLTKPASVWNNWDHRQLQAFGIATALSGNTGKGNTPLVSTDNGTTWAGVGSMVAGPDTYYTNDYNPDCSASTSFEDDVACVGPWQRIATANAKMGGSGPITPATSTGAVQNTSVATSAGVNLSTANPLPSATNAIRFVHGSRRLGELETARVTFRITNAAAFIASLNDNTFCLDSTGGDTSDVAAKDNPWRYYEPAHQCALLSANANLLKQSLFVNGQGGNGGSLVVGDVVGYQITYTNTSANPLTNVTLTDTPNDTTRLRLVVDPANAGDPATAKCPYSSYDGTPSGPAYNLGASSTTQAVWQPVPSVAPGASFTVFLCAEVIGGAKGDRIENTASVTHTLPGGGTETLTSTAGGTIASSISGHVYADNDASGGLTSGDTGLSGVTVELYLDNDGDGTLSAGDTLAETTSTLADGSYEFPGVVAGSYIVVETDPAGHGSIADSDTALGACNTGNGCNTIGTITVTGTESHTGNDFFDTPPALTNTISGTVYVDVDSNQVFEPAQGEQGEGGVTVRLYQDTNGNGIVDGGEPLLQTQVTDASGGYTFLLAAQQGNFVMEIDTGTLPAGSTMTTDNVEVASFTGFGNSDTGNDFGFIRPPAFSVTKSSACANPPTGCGGTTVNAGQIVTYTIGITNTSGEAQFEVRVNDPLPTGTNYVLQSTTATGFLPSTSSASDDFESITYTGGSGFASSWTEINDDNNATGGDVKIKTDKGSQRLQIKKNNKGIQRDVNLASCTNATVSFSYRRKKFDADDVVMLDVVGGATIATFTGPVDDKAYQSGTFSIPDASLSAATTLRFLSSGAFNGTFLFDDFVVTATCPVAVTKSNAPAASSPLDDGTPPNLVTAADNFFLAPGQSMTVTFQVIVQSPLDPSITQIVNTVGVRSKANPVPATATVTDTVDQFTLATIASIVALDDGGGVAVRWETSSEIGTAGFYLARYDWGRKRWMLVSNELVPGLRGSPQGGAYTLRDPGASPGERLTYALLELETRGGVRVHGPYDVRLGATSGELSPDGEGEVKKPSPRMVRRLARRRRAEKVKRRRERARAGTALKIHVRANGLYFVDAARIAEAFGVGLDQSVALIRRNRLTLENLGEPVAWTPALGDSGIYFYGEAAEDVYAPENVYRLRVGRGLRMKTSQAGAASAVGGQSFIATTHREENKFGGVSVPHEPGADFWYWEFVMSDHPSFGTRQFDVNVPGLVATGGAGELVVELKGATSVGVPDEHRVFVSVNGLAVGESSWTGFERHEARFSFPAHYLAEGSNVVELVGKLDPEVSYSIFYIDGFTLSYPRRYEAKGSELLFESSGRAGITVDGFADASIVVLDLKDARRPRLVRALNVEPSGATFRVSFLGRSGSTPYLAVSASGLRAPAAFTVGRRSPRLERGRGADYVVIAPEELIEGANALARLRRREGLSARVVVLEDVYDQFGYGLETPEAVKAFLVYAHRKWRPAPRYVVLAGRGNFDHRDYLKLGGNLFPPLMVRTPQGLFASDSAFADVVGDDGVPDIAVGRIPVLTNDELAGYVEKIRRYESEPPGPWVSRVLMLADNADARSNFPQDSERLIGFIPPGYDVERVYLSQLTSQDARIRLFTALREGAGRVHYFGHGGLDRLANEGLLLSSDVDRLQNRHQPIMTFMTCSVGRFGIPGFTPLASELVRSPGGGAVAVWSPTGLSKNGQAGVLAERFFLASFGGQGLRLGDEIVRALREFASLGGTRAMVELYQLLGDPALRPKGGRVFRHDSESRHFERENERSRHRAP